MKKELLEQNQQFEILFEDKQTKQKPTIEIRYWLKDGQTKEDFENDWEKYSDLIKDRIDSIIMHHQDLYRKYKFKQKFEAFTEHEDDGTPVYYQSHYIIED